MSDVLHDIEEIADLEDLRTIPILDLIAVLHDLGISAGGRVRMKQEFERLTGRRFSVDEWNLLRHERG